MNFPNLSLKSRFIILGPLILSKLYYFVSVIAINIGLNYI